MTQVNILSLVIEKKMYLEKYFQDLLKPIHCQKQAGSSSPWKTWLTCNYTLTVILSLKKNWFSLIMKKKWFSAFGASRKLMRWKFLTNTWNWTWTHFNSWNDPDSRSFSTMFLPRCHVIVVVFYTVWEGPRHSLLPASSPHSNQTCHLWEVLLQITAVFGIWKSPPLSQTLHGDSL